MRDMKQNFAQYAYLTKQEKNCLIQAGPENCLILNASGNWNKKTYTRFYSGSIYRIKRDYQKYQEIEPYINSHDGMAKIDMDPYSWTASLSINHEDFVCFVWKDGSETLTVDRHMSKLNCVRFKK